MATEAPLIRDGSQCVAGANLYNPGSALSGPGGSGQFLFVNITAARTVGIVAGNSGPIYGILQNTPPQGQPADVGIAGISKLVAGAAVSAGAALMSDSSGRGVTQSSTNPAGAIALEAATAANQIITVAIIPSMGQT